MKTRWIIETCLLGCVGVLWPQVASGLRVLADGTVVDEAGEIGTWHGEFDTAGGRIEGHVEVQGGESQRHTADVNGLIDLQNGVIGFEMISGPRSGSFFHGRVTQDGVEGEFSSADGRSGTWVGSWRPAPGRPAPILEASAEEIPGAPAPLFGSVDIEDEDPCSLLLNPGAMGVISGGGRATLEMLCTQRTAESAASASQGSSLARMVTALFGPSGWVTERLAAVLGIAIAQSPPTNVLVNCPSSSSGCTPGPDGSDQYPHVTQNEVSVAASGANSQILVTAYNDFSHVGLIGYASSSNGGQTWSDRGAPPPPPGPTSVNGSDPVVVSDASSTSSRGNFYLARIGLFPGNGIAVSRSKTSGVTFELPKNASDRTFFADKPDMRVDPTTGYVYVCWTEVRSNGTQVRFARSTNAGTDFTFQPSVALTQLDSTVSPAAGVQGCSIAVSQSNVFVAWWQRRTRKIEIVRSINQGQAFQGTPCCDPGALTPGATCGSLPVCTVVGSASAPPTYGLDVCEGRNILVPGSGDPFSPYLLRNTPFAYLAADALTPGIIQAVWDHYVGQSSEIYFSRCDNCAQTSQTMVWTSAVRVNDSTTNDQFQPRIATSIYTDVGGTQYPETRVVWYDRRRDPGNVAYDVYQTTSLDRGVTWQASSRLTDVAAPNPLPQLNPNFDCSAFDCYFGDYIGLSDFPTLRGTFVAAWGDTRGPQVSGTPCPGRPAASVDPNVRAAVGC
jgi:hypothetical protein